MSSRPSSRPPRVEEQSTPITYSKRPQLHQQHFNPPRRTIKRPRISHERPGFERQQTLTQLLDPSEPIWDSEEDINDADADERAMPPPKLKKRKRGKLKTESQNTLTQLNFVHRSFSSEEGYEDEAELWQSPGSTDNDDGPPPTPQRAEGRGSDDSSEAFADPSTLPKSTKQRAQRRRVPLSNVSGNSTPVPVANAPPKNKRVMIQSPKAKLEPLTPADSSPLRRRCPRRNHSPPTIRPVKAYNDVAYIPDSEESDVSPFSSPEKPTRQAKWEPVGESSPLAAVEVEPITHGENDAPARSPPELHTESTDSVFLPSDPIGMAVVDEDPGAASTTFEPIPEPPPLSSDTAEDGSDAATVLVLSSQQELDVSSGDLPIPTAKNNDNAFTRRSLGELLSEWIDDTVIPFPPLSVSACDHVS